jgi:hypothetical protein
LLVCWRTQPANQISNDALRAWRLILTKRVCWKLKEGLVKLLLKRANFRRQGVSREGLEYKVSMR